MEKRKIINLIVIIFMGVVLSSCVDYTTLNPKVPVKEKIEYIDDEQLSAQLGIIVSSYDFENFETYSFEFEEDKWIGSFYFNGSIDDKLFVKLYDLMYSSFTDYTIEEWRYSLSTSKPVLEYDGLWEKSPYFEYIVYVNGELFFSRYQEMRQNAKLVYEKRSENLLSYFEFRSIDNIDLNGFREDLMAKNTNVKSVDYEKTFCVDVENNAMIIRITYKKEPEIEEFENIKIEIENDLLNRPLYNVDGENRVGRPSKVYLFTEYGSTYFEQSVYDDETKIWNSMVMETTEIYDPLLYRILLGD